MKTLTKLLSANDVGETGSHQAGILVPKYGGFLGFFPQLDPDERNPDAILRFSDPLGTWWEFRFVYYNNARFGGTRNEYRLTRMTRFFRSHRAVAGDGLVLSVSSNGKYSAKILHTPESKRVYYEPRFDDSAEIVAEKTIELVFDSNWNIVETKE